MLLTIADSYFVLAMANLGLQNFKNYRIYSSIIAFFCTKISPKKSGATYTRGVTCTRMLLLWAYYLDGALHLHVCMHAHAMTITIKRKAKLDGDKLFEDSECSDFEGF